MCDRISESRRGNCRKFNPDHFYYDIMVIMNKKFWIGVFAVPAAADLYAAFVKHEGTLSQFGRETFRTDTAAGKAAWIASWAALSAWLIPHVCKWPQDIKDIVDEIS